MDSYERALQRFRRDSTPLARLQPKIGVPYATLREIKVGIVKNPGYATVKKIAEYYERAV